jgi:hypothetical protein
MGQVSVLSKLSRLKTTLESQTVSFLANSPLAGPQAASCRDTPPGGPQDIDTDICFYQISQSSPISSNTVRTRMQLRK